MYIREKLKEIFTVLNMSILQIHTTIYKEGKKKALQGMKA